MFIKTNHQNLKGELKMSTQNFKLALTISASLAVNVELHAASWTATSSMSMARSYHTATPLINGKVLVAGGQHDRSTFVNSTEVFDLTTNTWSNAAAMVTARHVHTATLLANGKVLVAGGHDGNAIVNSTEVFDLTTNTWSNAGAMATARYAHTATLLANGKVLVAGGHDGSAYVNSAEVFDVTTGIWSNAAAMATARSAHTATLLANGKVLVAGGYDGSAYVNSAEVFDVTTNTWSNAAAMATTRDWHTATSLPNGKVLVTGGHLQGYYGNTSLNGAEVFDLTTSTWSNTGAMATARHAHTATLLANGKVLVTGGYNGSTYVNSPEVFDLTTGTWSNTAAMATARYAHTATLLANGKILVTGGVYINSAELYTPDAVTTTTTLTSSRNPSILNQSVTFTATVAATPVPTGTVTFKVDGTTTAATSLSGGQTTYTTTSLTLGNRLIRAEYAGNSTWAASAAQLTQTVSTGADFVITNLSMNPVAPAVNQTFTVRGVVKNTSTVAGAAGNLSLWLDKATAVAGCNAAADKVIPIGTLAAAASKAFSVNLTAAAASGTKTLRAFIDSACATVETNENNNQITKTYTVGAPDVTISSITLTPAAPVTGATFTAKVVVKNQGANPISSSFLDLWLNQSTPQNCGAASEQWATIDALAAGASQTIIFSGLSVATAGTKTLRVYADSWCETADANRSNNQLTKTYTVQ